MRLHEHLFRIKYHQHEQKKKKINQKLVNKFLQ